MGMLRAESERIGQGLVLRSRYIIACLELCSSKVVEDFYAYTYKQAQYRLRQQSSLFPSSNLVLLPFSSLLGWVGDSFGEPVIRAGKAYVDFKLQSSESSALMTGVDIFTSSGAQHGHKFDLTIVCSQAGQTAIAYDGVLWARDKSAEVVLSQVGEKIDSLVG